MYGSPKIHKPDTPLRPIVDYTGTIAYRLSRDLADLLKPLVGKTVYHAGNSCQLTAAMRQLTIEDDEMLVSYDVVSLFTKTPIDQALVIIDQRLRDDQTLKDRTNLTVDDIVTLLKFVLGTTYFRFGGQFYQQKFGVAMGSPVSPIVVDLFMEDLEEKIISTSTDDIRPRNWKRYVDDIECIVKRGKAELLQHHMNKTDPTGSIQFTREEEENGSLPFLDANYTRQVDGSIKATVYRKKTHTDQYLNFASHHPTHQKLGVVRTLMGRIDTIVTEEDDKIKEEQHIKTALKRCGYPSWALKKPPVTSKDPAVPKKTSTEKFRGQVVLPYVAGVTERVSRAMKKYGVSSAMRPHTTMRNLLVRPKDKLDIIEQGEMVYSIPCSNCDSSYIQRELVYSIPCSNCDSSYIGETGRLFSARVDEHQKDVESVETQQYTRAARKQSQSTRNKSALSDHATQDNHVINWRGAKIVDRESHQRLRQVREAIWIRKTVNNLNRDEGSYELSHVYDGVLNTNAPSTGRR